jgi:putative aminopeptidase FrvX
MDETGFTVESIRDDGRLELNRRQTAWEAQAALVHTVSGDVEAVFEPREDYFFSEVRRPLDPMTVYLGTSSKEETEALGIEVGTTTVTMPKELQRMGRHRVLARGLDDRVGCTALLLAAQRIDPDLLTKRITFAWSVEEEIGLNGAEALAKRLTDATMVFPVDTFVSSDSPLEWEGTAYCPLGQGAVIRVLESSNFSPRSAVTQLLELAKAGNIDVQLGMTLGGTDGQPFMANDTVDVPLSWPGRNSHSPVEVADLRDVESLVELIVRIATN